jgi:hypothetical protein
MLVKSHVQIVQDNILEVKDHSIITDDGSEYEVDVRLNSVDLMCTISIPIDSTPNANEPHIYFNYAGYNTSHRI